MSASDRGGIAVSNDKGTIGRRALGRAPSLSALISRRGVLLGAASGVAACAIAPAGADFDPLPGPDDAVAPGFKRQVLISWRDPLWSGVADPARCFGYNNDYLAFFALPTPEGEDEAGLLVVNHEYPIPQLMFDGIAEDTPTRAFDIANIVETMDAVGISVLEVRRRGEDWRVVQDSAYARRVTAHTPIGINGPAAGHRRMQTHADPSGRRVLGTHDNCNGGVTPWRTFLSGEEGSRDFFGGDIRSLPDESLLARYHYRDMEEHGAFGWPRAERRFDVQAEPNEPNRFEWVVEIDPFDPSAPPIKRTALGRFAHEGAHCAVCPDGRVAVYLGDDWEFEYCYRFVTRDAYDPNNRAVNRDLLDNGVLCVARFNEDGTLDWLPLIFGEGPLTPANGFSDQGDVLIQTRRAADLLGATPMDCPEGYQPHPTTGRVYVVLTGNDERTEEQINAANPRAENKYGHLLELIPPDRDGKPDHAATRYDWSVFLLCDAEGKPNRGFHPRTAAGGKFVAPDNINFDANGRMWVCSDGPGPRNEDGLWVMPLQGEERLLSRLIYRPPIGAECCGPAFTPDGETIFVSVQHPGAGSDASLQSSDWPSARTGARAPSVIALRRSQ